MSKRHSGFVVGSTQLRGRPPVWSVRVKDPGSQFDGAKFTVASIHAETELARGLNVSFIIGSVDDPNGQKVPRAVDVRVENYSHLVENDGEKS